MKTQKTIWLINQLKDISGGKITFEIKRDFFWNFENQTIYYNPEDENFAPLILHEFGHFLLGHKNYKKDIELISMEKDAWKKAKEIAKKINATGGDFIVEIGFFCALFALLAGKLACRKNLVNIFA